MRRWLISATIRIPLAPSWQRPGKTPSVKQGGDGIKSQIVAEIWRIFLVLFQRGEPAGALTAIAFLLYKKTCAGPSRPLNAVVDDEVRALPADMQARYLRFGDIIEQVGLPGLPRDAVRHLEGKLWELRMSGRDGISRAIYVTASGQRVVVVRVFVKKTQKTPRSEIEIARQRAKEIV